MGEDPMRLSERIVEDKVERSRPCMYMTTTMRREDQLMLQFEFGQQYLLIRPIHLKLLSRLILLTLLILPDL